MIIGNGVTPADFTTPAGEAFVAGAPGVLAGMAKFSVTQFHPKSVAILANDNDAGKAGVAVIMKPIFDKADITVKDVYVANDASAPDVQSAMSAIGADKADVFLSILTLQSCISMYDAIKAPRRDADRSGDDGAVLRHTDDPAPEGRRRRRRRIPTAGTSAATGTATSCPRRRPVWPSPA